MPLKYKAKIMVPVVNIEIIADNTSSHAPTVNI